MLLPASPLLPLPREGQMSRALYEEAARHLQDARILHTKSTLPRFHYLYDESRRACIKISPHSVWGFRWLDAALQTHKVFDEVSKSPDVTKTFLDALENHDPFLPDDIRSWNVLYLISQISRNLPTTRLPIRNIRFSPSSPARRLASPSHFILPAWSLSWLTARSIFKPRTVC